MKYLMKQNKFDAVTQGIFRIIYPAKCLFCNKVLDYKNAHTCYECQEKLTAPYPYNKNTKVPIHALKYQGVKTLARPIAHAMAKSINFNPDYLMPVPLHQNRLKARGFNQAALLSMELAKIMNIPAIDGLVRVRDTAPQYGLSSKERAKNLENAIALKEGFDPSGASILLVDDIYTTGATARACECALKNAGAKRVEMVAFAKA